MDRSCREFVDALASKEPVPGGGGASALVGAVGTAAGNMVGSLTLGKKKYAKVQEDIEALCIKANRLETELLVLIEKDAMGFEPLSRAYSLPADTEEEKQEKERVMEESLYGASMVPLEIMEKCAQAIEVNREFAEKGAKIAISDAGAGAVFCKAAMEAAGLNVFINTSSMKDKETAGKLEEKAEGILRKYKKMADDTLETVTKRIRRGNG